MHYFGENMHKTIVFLHKSEKLTLFSIIPEEKLYKGTA